MRMIKEMVRILFSLAFGKKYASVELEKVNKYEVSGKNLKDFLNMIDAGQINEAEMSLCLYTENLKNQSKRTSAAFLFCGINII